MPLSGRSRRTSAGAAKSVPMAMLPSKAREQNAQAEAGAGAEGQAAVFAARDIEAAGVEKFSRITIGSPENSRHPGSRGNRWMLQGRCDRNYGRDTSLQTLGDSC